MENKKSESVGIYPINDQSDNNNEIQNGTNQNKVPPKNVVPEECCTLDETELIQSGIRTM